MVQDIATTVLNPASSYTSGGLFQLAGPRVCGVMLHETHASGNDAVAGVSVLVCAKLTWGLGGLQVCHHTVRGCFRPPCTAEH